MSPILCLIIIFFCLQLSCLKYLFTPQKSLTAQLTWDYVTPIKEIHLHLNSKDLFNVAQTYRSKGSEIWDSHPNYILKVFGQQLHLVLHQNSSFIPTKTYGLINDFDTHTEKRQHAIEDNLGCYYNGYVKGDTQSAVAVSLCHGMTGFINTTFGVLFIEPANDLKANNASSTSAILHKIRRYIGPTANHAVPGHVNSEPRQLTIELLVAYDSTMKDFYKKQIRSYIMTLVSIASNVFADASIGSPIKIYVTNIVLIKVLKQSGKDKLDNFCKYIKDNGYHFDAAVFLTREEICSKIRFGKCDTLGNSMKGSMCKENACAVVHDNGLQTAFTIAHELGHILNMPHDDDEYCKDFNTKDGKGKLHVMSAQARNDADIWSWSDCSRHFFAEFVEQEYATCLEDTSTVHIRYKQIRLPGEIYSLDQQCKLTYGNESIGHCQDTTNPCQNLKCYTKNAKTRCLSNNLHWADGTPCKGKLNWCQKGECVPRQGQVRPVIHGVWGPWSPWNQCSLTCGGGVQKRQRECNNPLPANGGKYCAGDRKQYSSCNTQNCPPGSMDARQKLCYQATAKSISISTKCVPKYEFDVRKKCRLRCVQEGTSGDCYVSDKLIDGTTCSVDSHDKCVNGVCKPAGCDNKLNSMAKLDRCGVCEGHNETCVDITGSFTIADLYKKQATNKELYFSVTTIPKGATNIVIEQPNDKYESYIALREDQGIYLLNGNFSLKGFPYVTYYGGVAIEYNGSRSLLERVNSTYSRNLQRDLRVEIISYIQNSKRANESILLTYRYTMDKMAEDFSRYKSDIKYK